MLVVVFLELLKDTTSPFNVNKNPDLDLLLFGSRKLKSM